MRRDIGIKTLAVVTAVSFTQLLIGCSGNLESEFLDKLKAEIDNEGERCYDVKDFLDLELLDNGGTQYLAVMSGSVMNFYKEQQARGLETVKALKQAGYVGGAKKMKYNFREYTGHELNEEGRKHVIWGKGVCVGHRNITEIVEYTEPSDQMGATFTEVTYKYDVIQNDVVSDLGLEEKVKAKLPGEDKAFFVKTNKGWRLK